MFPLAIQLYMRASVRACVPLRCVVVVMAVAVLGLVAVWLEVVVWRSSRFDGRRWCVPLCWPVAICV